MWNKKGAKEVYEVSNCCGAKVYQPNGETGRCSKCKKRCGVLRKVLD